MQRCLIQAMTERIVSRFYKFLVVRFLSAFGTQIVLFAAPLIVYQKTGSVAYSGLSFAIEWGIGMLALPIAGVVSDRLGGSKLYASSDFVRFVTCVACFYLLHVFPDDAFLIVSLSAGILAFCLSAAFIALESVVPKYMPSDDIYKAQSLLQLIDQTSLLLGPAVATLFLVFLDVTSLYLFASTAFAFSFLSMIFSRKVTEVTSESRIRSPLADLRVGAAALFAERKLILLIVYGMMVNVVYCALFSVGVAMVTGEFGLPETHYGILIIFSAVTTILTVLLIPAMKKLLSMQTIGLVAAMGVALGGLIVSVATEYWVFVAGFAMVVATDAMAGVYLRTERVKFIPQEHLGKTLGIMSLLIVTSYPLAGLLVTLFSERIGVGPLMMILSMTSLLGNLLIVKAMQGRPAVVVLD
jgi:MFS family permease